MISDERLAELIGYLTAYVRNDCITREDADTLAILLAEQQRRSDGWISVNDRYPEVDQRVLYYFDEVGIHVGKYHGPEDGIHYFGGRSGFLGGDVTHWQPLPAAPKESET